jgi:hypothetical protein
MEKPLQISGGLTYGLSDAAILALPQFSGTGKNEGDIAALRYAMGGIW